MHYGGVGEAGGVAVTMDGCAIIQSIEAGGVASSSRLVFLDKVADVMHEW